MSVHTPISDTHVPLAGRPHPPGGHTGRARPRGGRRVNPGTQAHRPQDTRHTAKPTLRHPQKTHVLLLLELLLLLLLGGRLC